MLISRGSAYRISGGHDCENEGVNILKIDNWHLSKSYATNAAMSNKWLEKQGLINIKYLWCKAQGYI